MTMVRTIVLNNSALQYVGPTPKSVFLILHGTAQYGNNLTVYENGSAFLTGLKNGAITDSRIILAPQLSSGQWSLTSIINYAKTFNLPIDVFGFDIGGTAASDAIQNNTNVFRSVVTVSGNVQTSDYPAYRLVPSSHFYDPSDTVIPNGYTNINNLVNQMNFEGKPNITFTSLSSLISGGYTRTQCFDAVLCGVMDSQGHPLPGFSGIISYLAGIDIIKYLWINGDKIRPQSAPIVSVEVK